MAGIEIMKCDGCGEEVRGAERIAFNIWNDWLEIKVTGVLIRANETCRCDDAIYHFCPKCRKPLYAMLIASPLDRGVVIE